MKSNPFRAISRYENTESTLKKRGCISLTRSEWVAVLVVATMAVAGITLLILGMTGNLASSSSSDAVALYSLIGRSSVLRHLDDNYTASSPASYGNDGDVDTWTDMGVQNASTYWEVDLGSPMHLTNVIITARPGYGYRADGLVIALDGVTCGTTYGFAAAANYTAITFSCPLDGQFLRLYNHVANQGEGVYWLQVSEVSVTYETVRSTHLLNRTGLVAVNHKISDDSDFPDTNYPPSNAIDGNPATIFRTKDVATPSYWELDMGTEQQVSHFGIICTYYDMNVTVNGTYCATIESQQFSPAIGETAAFHRTYYACALSGRYIRISTVVPNYAVTSYFMQMSDFVVGVTV